MLFASPLHPLGKLQPPPGGRAHPYAGDEHAAEMALAGEAAGKRDFRDRHPIMTKHLLGSFNAPLGAPLMR